MAKHTAQKSKRLFVSRILCDFENSLGEYLTTADEQGYELATPPSLVRFGDPPGFNGYVVGFDHPFFLVLLRTKEQ